MARILYGVQGDGRGHLNRALSVAGLLPQHEFLFLGDGPVAEVAAKGHAFERLPMLAHVARNSRVDVPATLLSWGKTLAGVPANLRRLTGLIRHFDPDLIITDYEFMTPRAARLSGRPCLSLDHQHVLTHTRHVPPPGQPGNRLLTQAGISFVGAPASRFLITSFYKPPLKRPDRDFIVGTLVQPDVLTRTPKDEDFAVVYIRHADPDTLETLLRGRKRQYRVYGFGALPERGNVRFMPTCRENFLNDLTAAAYVLSNGGYGLLSEALHLGKPVFSVPTYLFFEQYWNGYFLEHGGYGSWHPDLNIPPDKLDRFEEDLDFFRRRILATDFCGRAEIRRCLDNLLGAA